MEHKFIIEKFEDFLFSEYQKINEAGGNKTGFVAIFGSTDAENLGAVVAPKIGIKPDTIYSITINGEKDLLTLGKNTSYKGFANIKEAGKSKPQEDYISVKSGSSTGEIKSGVKAKGNFIVDFDKSSSIEIQASNNGLLALLRACKSMNDASDKKDTFSTGGSWTGKLLISMGNPQAEDTSRNSAFLAVSPNVNGGNGIRNTEFDGAVNRGNLKGSISKYISESNSFENFEFLFEAETPAKAPKAESIKVIGDSIADAIRAAYYYNSTGKLFVNNFGPYKGFRDAAIKYKETIGKEDWEKGSKIGKSSYILAVLLQEIFNRIGYSYPMDWKFQNLVPKCKEFLTSFGGKELSSANRETLSGMLAFYQPTKYKIPTFDPVLPDFWNALTNAVVSRVSITIRNNVRNPDLREEEKEKVEIEGKEKSGVNKNVSGGV